MTDRRCKSSTCACLKQGGGRTQFRDRWIPVRTVSNDGQETFFEGSRLCPRSTLNFPENRSDPKARIIGVGFARFRRPSVTGVPPIFQLVGGPGASFLEGLKPGANKKPVPGLDLYRGIGDVVFIDQRGFSERGDVLKFKYRTTGHPLDEALSIARD